MPKAARSFVRPAARGKNDEGRFQLACRGYYALDVSLFERYLFHQSAGLYFQSPLFACIDHCLCGQNCIAIAGIGCEQDRSKVVRHRRKKGIATFRRQRI